MAKQNRRTSQLQILAAGGAAPLAAPQLLRTGISLTAATGQRGFAPRRSSRRRLCATAPAYGRCRSGAVPCNVSMAAVAVAQWLSSASLETSTPPTIMSWIDCS